MNSAKWKKLIKIENEEMALTAWRLRFATDFWRAPVGAVSCFPHDWPASCGITWRLLLFTYGAFLTLKPMVCCCFFCRGLLWGLRAKHSL